MAVYRSILQHIAVYRNILQYIAVYCSILQYIAVYRSILQYFAVYCSISQYIAVHRSVSHFLAVIDPNSFGLVLSNISSNHFKFPQYHFSDSLIMQSYTFRSEKSYRVLRFGLKIKTDPLEMAPIICPFTRVGCRSRP